MTADVVPFRRALTPERALVIIRAAVEDTGRKLGWSDHVFKQMADRDIVDRQVLSVLSESELRTGPKWNDEHEDWVCTLRRFVSGRSVTVVVGIDESKQEVTVITAY